MKRILAMVGSCLFFIGLLSGIIYAVDNVAQAKIDTNLTNAIVESSTSTSMAYVTMEDISDDEAMELFEQLHPNEYRVYMYSKYDDAGDMTAEEIAAIDDDAIQNAIECKRKVYKELYSESNESIIGQYYDDSDVVFLSSYAPVAIVETDLSSATWSARNSGVVSITAFTDAEMLETVNTATTDDPIQSITYLYDKIMDGIDLANQISRADTVRDEKGLTGEGVKIGIVEAEGVPDSSNAYLGSTLLHMRAGDYTNSPHATAVACILVGAESDGTIHGIVPDAELYCSVGSTVSKFYEAVEWLIDSGVNIINASLGYNNYLGYYDSMSKWIDHIAIQHDVHFVNSAGNNVNYITAPGMAYNAITVGSFDANGSDEVSAFTMAESSCYMEQSSEDDYRAEKPNLVANGVFADASIVVRESLAVEIRDLGGTSFAAPQVAGVIAQLCDYSSGLKTKQTQVGAILTASSAGKIEAVGTGAKGDSFITSVRVEGNPQISDKEGVGILDARWAWGIVVNHNYWSVGVYSGGFPYSMTVSIDASVNTLTRVAIFWLKYVTVTDHTSGSVSSTTAQISDLDLCVYGPDGTLLGSSTMNYANFEVVQFATPLTGTYTIVVKGPSNESVNLGIAVW